MGVPYPQYKKSRYQYPSYPLPVNYVYDHTAAAAAADGGDDDDDDDDDNDAI